MASTNEIALLVPMANIAEPGKFLMQLWKEINGHWELRPSFGVCDARSAMSVLVGLGVTATAFASTTTREEMTNALYWSSWEPLVCVIEDLDRLEAGWLDVLKKGSDLAGNAMTAGAKMFTRAYVEEHMAGRVA